MKVTIVNHSDSRGGASVAAARLTAALRGRGVEARMLVPHVANTQSESVVRLDDTLRYKAAFLAERGQIFMSNGFSYSRLFKVSTGSFGLPVSRHPLIDDADVVVLNWFNQGTMPLDDISRIAALGKPVVWIMHDMWPMTGICHHAGSCTKYMSHCAECPLLGRGAAPHDMSYRVFNRKDSTYSHVPICFVAVSSWLAGCAKASALLANRMVETIPNPFDAPAFPAVASAGRNELGLPDDGSDLVVMCAARLDDDTKNLPAAIDALNSCVSDKRITAVFCGEVRDKSIFSRLHIPYVALGPISDTRRLADIYAHASAVLSSSRFETLGLTLVEGMSAGAVPVAFGGDGRADVIGHLVNGYLAKPGDVADLAKGITWALTRPISRESLHLSAESRFDAGMIADRYIELFERLLSNNTVTP